MSKLLQYGLLLAGLLFTSFVYAQPAEVVTTAPTARDTSLLWRISGQGVSSPSYLFGTIHMIPAEDYFLPPHVASALRESQAVAFEIDPRDMENPAALMSIMGRINMLNDTSLNDLLPEADYNLVADYFEKAGLPMIIFKRMKPLFLSAMVGQDMSKMMGGLSAGNGGIRSYELELTRLAEADQKKISGLETMEFQLSLFDSIPYQAQAQMLLEAVKSDSGEKTENDQFAQMVAMYKRQAIYEMAGMIKDESVSMGRFEELLLTRRNESWIRPIGEMMVQDRSVFFAVGAGHLAGDKGVIKLLREAGYTVEPVYE